MTAQLRVGVDLCAADDVADAIDRFGDRYLERIYTPHERASCTGQPERLAARFAAKEATVKVLRPEAEGIDLRSIEIQRQPGGWCEVHLAGHAAELADRAGIGSLAVSISHDRGLATAVVIAQAHPTAPTHGGQA